MQCTSWKAGDSGGVAVDESLLTFRPKKSWSPSILSPPAFDSTLSCYYSLPASLSLYLSLHRPVRPRRLAQRVSGSLVGQAQVSSGIRLRVLIDVGHSRQEIWQPSRRRWCRYRLAGRKDIECHRRVGLPRSVPSAPLIESGSVDSKYKTTASIYKKNTKQDLDGTPKAFNSKDLPRRPRGPRKPKGKKDDKKDDKKGPSQQQVKGPKPKGKPEKRQREKLRTVSRQHIFTFVDSDRCEELTTDPSCAVVRSRSVHLCRSSRWSLTRDRATFGFPPCRLAMSNTVSILRTAA